MTDKPPAFAPPSTPAPPKGAYLQSWDTQARFYKGRDPPSQTRRSAPASDPRRGSPVLGTSAGTGVGELTRVAGLGSRFRTVRFDSWGLGVATLPGVRRNPFSGEPTLQPPRLRLEKGERRERDWDSGAGSPEPGGGGWSPPPGGGRHGRPRTPVAGRSPNPVCPHPGRSAPRTGARAPGSARLHLRIWGAAPRRLPGPPSRSPGSRRAVPSLEKDPGVTQRGRLPGKGRLPARGARGAAGKRRLRCAGSGPAERPAAPPAPTSSSSARPRHSAPLPGSAAPGPPLPAPRCGLRRREQRVSRPASPLPRGEKGGEEGAEEGWGEEGRAEGGGGEGGGGREREIRPLDLSLARCQREQSNYSPWGTKFFKNPCYCFRRHITFLHFPGSSGLAFSWA